MGQKAPIASRREITRHYAIDVQAPIIQEQEMKKSDFDGLMRSMKEAQTFLRTGKLKGGKIHIPAQIDAAA
jgi:hypothetical protein